MDQSMNDETDLHQSTFHNELASVIQSLQKSIRKDLKSSKVQLSQEEEIDIILEQMKKIPLEHNELEIISHLKDILKPTDEEQESIGKLLRDTDWSNPVTSQLSLETLNHHPNEVKIVSSLIDSLQPHLCISSSTNSITYPSKKSRMMASDESDGDKKMSGFDFVFDLNALDDFPAYEPLQNVLVLFENDPTSKEALNKLMAYDLNDLFENCQWEELRVALLRALELSLGYHSNPSVSVSASVSTSVSTSVSASVSAGNEIGGSATSGSSSSMSSSSSSSSSGSGLMYTNSKPDPETQVLALRVHERLMRGLNGYQLPDCVCNIIRYLTLAWDVHETTYSDSFLICQHANLPLECQFADSIELLNQQKACFICAWELLSKLGTQCTPECMCKITAGLVLLLSRGSLYVSSGDFRIPILQVFAFSSSSEIADNSNNNQKLLTNLSSYFRLSKFAVNNLSISVQLGFIRQLLTSVPEYSEKYFRDFPPTCVPDHSIFSYHIFCETIILAILAPFADKSTVLESVFTLSAESGQWSGECDHIKSSVYESLPQVVKVVNGNKLLYLLHGCNPFITEATISDAESSLTSSPIMFDKFLQRASHSCIRMMELIQNENSHNTTTGEIHSNTVNSLWKELFIAILPHTRVRSNIYLLSDAIQYAKFYNGSELLQDVLNTYIDITSCMTGNNLEVDTVCDLIWVQLVEATFKLNINEKPLWTIMLGSISPLLRRYHRSSTRSGLDIVNTTDIVPSLTRVLLYALHTVSSALGQRPIVALMLGAYRRMSTTLRSLSPVFLNALARLIEALSEAPTSLLLAISDTTIAQNQHLNASGYVPSLQAEGLSMKEEGVTEGSVFADCAALSLFFLCDQPLFLESDPSEGPCVEDDVYQMESCMNSVLRFTTVHVHLKLLSGYVGDSLVRLITIALHKTSSPLPLLDILYGWLIAGYTELVFRIIYSAWIFPFLCSVTTASYLQSINVVVPSIESITVDWILSRTFSTVFNTGVHMELVCMSSQFWWSYFLDFLYSAMNDVSFRLLASKYLISAPEERASFSSHGVNGWDQETLFARGIIRLCNTIETFRECNVPNSISPHNEEKLDHAIATLTTTQRPSMSDSSGNEIFGTVAAGKSLSIEQLKALGDSLSTSEAISHLRALLLPHSTSGQLAVISAVDVMVCESVHTEVDRDAVATIVRIINEQYLPGIMRSSDALHSEVAWICAILDSSNDLDKKEVNGCIWFLAIVSLLVPDDLFIPGNLGSSLNTLIRHMCGSIFGGLSHSQYISHVYTYDTMTRSMAMFSENGCPVELVLLALRRHWMRGYLSLREILFTTFEVLVTGGWSTVFDRIIRGLADEVQRSSDDLTLCPVGVHAAFEIWRDT